MWTSNYLLHLLSIHLIKVVLNSELFVQELLLKFIFKVAFPFHCY